MHLFADRFQWGEGRETNILLKSLNVPAMFLAWFICIPLVLKIRTYIPYIKGSQKNLVTHLAISILISIGIDVLSELIKFCILFFYDTSVFSNYVEKIIEDYDIYFINVSITSVIIYWAFLLYLSGVDYQLKYQDEQLKRTEAEKLIAKAELTALRMQIQPHFLFNTLNSISSLIDDDREEAQEVIGQLGDLLRYTLDQKSDFIPLKTELKFIENYLEIEHVRFKDRIQTEYHIEEETKEIHVPSFILQPLIENTIKHGLSKTNSPCTISIESKIKEENLYLSVSDNADGEKVLGKGIGLENTEHRLKNYYGTAYHFSYKVLSPGFRVELSFPIRYKRELDEPN